MPILNALGGSFYDDNHVFFILETICVMAFAASFILKGHGQLSNRGFDKGAAQSQLAATGPSSGGTPPLRRCHCNLRAGLRVHLPERR
jgi:hypothetical protein